MPDSAGQTLYYINVMPEPDDFGLSPVQTLAHVADPTRIQRFTAFWKTWTAGVFASEPRLRERREDDPSDPTATHEFESARHARIGCRLLWPEARATGGLVVLHGYSELPSLEQTESEWRELAERGVAILCLRVRGYPGSQLDCRPLVDHAGGVGGRWITYGLSEPISDQGYGCAWSFSLAAADVVNAYRALRRELARSPMTARAPISIEGHSLGGALAILAASVLADRDEPARLAIGVPTMGDWTFRLSLPAHRTGGAGEAVREYIADHPRESEILDLLRVHDAAVHARRVRCPVLCKLAMRDDVVPAPAAAAVFNNLASPPGLKRRFVVRCGHYDGGIADMRRHAAFERLSRDFLDPAADPEEVLLREPALR
jgi:cephalosporin-C deacetylase-like acetyl esterase